VVRNVCGQEERRESWQTKSIGWLETSKNDAGGECQEKTVLAGAERQLGLICLEMNRCPYIALVKMAVTLGHPSLLFISPRLKQTGLRCAKQPVCPPSGLITHEDGTKPETGPNAMSEAIVVVQSPMGG
jgi:hypothetical protein